MKKYKVLGLFLSGLLLLVSTGSCADKNEPFGSENDFKIFKIGDSRDDIVEKGNLLSDAGEIMEFSPGKDGTSYNFKADIFNQNCYVTLELYSEKLYKFTIFQKSDSSLSGFNKKIKKIFANLYGEPVQADKVKSGGEYAVWDTNGKMVRMLSARNEKLGEIFYISIFDKATYHLVQVEEKQKKEEMNKKKE